MPEGISLRAFVFLLITAYCLLQAKKQYQVERSKMQEKKLKTKTQHPNRSILNYI
jgi:hypothetical protein